MKILSAIQRGASLPQRGGGARAGRGRAEGPLLTASRLFTKNEHSYARAAPSYRAELNLRSIEDLQGRTHPTPPLQYPFYPLSLST